MKSTTKTVVSLLGLLVYEIFGRKMLGITKKATYTVKSKLQSWTKLLKHLANFHLFSQHSSVLQPPPPHFNVVNALVFLKQSLLNRKSQETTLKWGGGG